MLHAGPGGIIIDSKVKTNLLGPGGAPGGPGAPGSPTTSAASSSSFGSPFGSSAGFGSSSFGSSAGIGSSAKRERSIRYWHWSQRPAGPGHFSSRAASRDFDERRRCGGRHAAGCSVGRRTTDSRLRASSLPWVSRGSRFLAIRRSVPPGAGRFRNATAMADPNNPGPQPDGTAQDPQAMLQAMLQNQSNPQQTMQAPNGFSGNNNSTAGNSNTAHRLSAPILRTARTQVRWVRWAMDRQAAALQALLVERLDTPLRYSRIRRIVPFGNSFTICSRKPTRMPLAWGTRMVLLLMAL